MKIIVERISKLFKEQNVYSGILTQSIFILAGLGFRNYQFRDELAFDGNLIPFLL